jgi:hypothetical protein
MSSRIGTSIAIALFAAAVPQLVMAQSDPLAGTWEFHPEKSTFTPGPARYKSMTVTFAGQNQMTMDGVDAQGKPIKGTFAAVPDGKPHPVSGMAEFDASTLTRFSDTVTSYMYTKRKSNVVVGNRVLSRDGNVLTFSEKTYDDKGKQTGTIMMVFAKPGFDFASLNQPAPARTAGTTLTSPLTPAETAAAAALEKGEDDAAIAMFTKVIEAKQPTPMLYYDHVGRGIAYAKKSQHDQALADFDAALKLKPDDADALFRRAGTHLQLKQYQAAIDDFSASIMVDGTNAMAYRLRGFAYNTLGNDKAAGADYDKACALNKDLCQN